MNWYSAQITVLIHLEGMGVRTHNKSVILVQAKDFDDAQQKVLEAGKSANKEYMNVDNQKVSWVFKSIDTLDFVGSRIESGQEVYSELLEVSEPYERLEDIDIKPELSEPGSTGILPLNQNLK